MASSREPLTTRDVLVELDQALSEHMAWLKAWHRVFLCGEQPFAGERADDPRDLGRFGAWYVKNRHQSLVNQPALRTLANLHRDMHERAYALAQTARSGMTVAASDYDAFMDAAAAFVTHARRLEKAFASASADLDPLTGLHNRHAMNRDLQREWSRALRLRRPSCFALADLDHFKSINDTHGHAVGDQVLAATAERLLGALRPYDTVYRYGGEEFLVCLPDVSAPMAVAIIERLLRELRSGSIALADGGSLSVTCSFGVAQVDSEATVEQIIEHADQALYEAKRTGRDRICVWEGGRPRATL